MNRFLAQLTCLAVCLIPTVGPQLGPQLRGWIVMDERA